MVDITKDTLTAQQVIAGRRQWAVIMQNAFVTHMFDACAAYINGRVQEQFYDVVAAIDGGGGGIRTHGRLSPTSVFKTGAFNHSATPPTAPC